MTVNHARVATAEPLQKRVPQCDRITFEKDFSFHELKRFINSVPRFTYVRTFRGLGGGGGTTALQCWASRWQFIKVWRSSRLGAERQTWPICFILIRALGEARLCVKHSQPWATFPLDDFDFLGYLLTYLAADWLRLCVQMYLCMFIQILFPFLFGKIRNLDVKKINMEFLENIL